MAHRLSLYKYNQRPTHQYKIDQDIDEEQSSDVDYDSASDGSSPTTESSGPPEAIEQPLWRKRRYQKMQPTLGLHGQNRRQSLDAGPLRPSGVLSTIIPTLNYPDHKAEMTATSSSCNLYTPIDRRNRLQRPFPRTNSQMNGFRGLHMIEEISPIRSNSPPPEVPPLRLTANWNPHITSTTGSLSGITPLLPKTNPHHAPKFMCSTPRTALQRRVMEERNFQSMNDLTDQSRSMSSNYYTDNEYEMGAPERPSPLAYRPEHFGLPRAIARNMGIHGIVYMSMSLCGRRLTLNLQRGFYFRDSTQVCSYLRARLRHRLEDIHNRRHSQSLARQLRNEESYRTRLVPTSNRPVFQETFQFTIPESFNREYLVIAVYLMDNADFTQTKKMMGCMAFPLRRLLAKARETNPDYFFYGDDTENAEEIEIDNGGFFLLDPKYGERQNLPQRKVQSKTYYNDPALLGCSSQNLAASTQSLAYKMNSAESSSALSTSVGIEGNGNFDIRVHNNPHHMDYTSASSSSANSDFRKMPLNQHLFHRATLPSITTTTSENTSDADGGSVMSPSERRRIDHHFLCPDNSAIHGANQFNFKNEPSTHKGHGGGSVRRAASFTFSPKNTVAKNNQRPIQLRDDNEKKERKFFGPISKTLSYLRNKMDTALSTSSLYPSKDEVRQWETSFDSLLNNKFGCALFRQFLKKEFSDENVDFWMECEEFKKMKEGKKTTSQKASEIYKEFVAEQSPKEVNLDSDTRAATKAALENGCRTDTFTLAQSRIEQLMAKDSYRRFLKDRLYLDLVEGFENSDAPQPSKEK